MEGWMDGWVVEGYGSEDEALTRVVVDTDWCWIGLVLDMKGGGCWLLRGRVLVDGWMGVEGCEGGDEALTRVKGTEGSGWWIGSDGRSLRRDLVG